MPNKLEVLWAWVEEQPNGDVGVIFTFIPFMGMSGNLQHRKREIAEAMGPIAAQHWMRTQHRVWLKEFHSFADHYKPDIA